jgi:hypothetical protein
MKAISASIIVLASSIFITAGGIIENQDTKGTVILAGFFIGLAGMVTWYKAIKETDNKDG